MRPFTLGLRGIRGVLFFHVGAAWGEIRAGDELTPAESTTSGTSPWEGSSR
jgi:hypothetical protein